MKKLLLPLIVFLVFSTVNMVSAQSRAASPACKIEQKVGLTDVTLEYSRPSKKDRTIFGETGLVPFGQLWRTGANSATKITFSDDVKVEEQDLGAGSYAILTIPSADEWTVNFYKYEASGWTSYREKTPDLSVKVTPVAMEETVETFLIGIGSLRDYSAVLQFIWESTYVPVNLTVK